jgi:hypothetical protein
MAGPWTVQRERDDAGTDLRTTLRSVGTRSSRALFTRLPGLRPPRPITLPDPGNAQSAGTGFPAAGATSAPADLPFVPGRRARVTSSRKSSLKTRWAAALLALMLAAAAVLAWATVSIAKRGVASSEAAARRTAGPLVIPAPKLVAGLPRRFGTIGEPGAAPIVAALRQRFGSIGAGLVSDAKHAAAAGQLPGRTAADITAAWTSGLYGQPGHFDPATSRPAWVMYLGLDANADIGSPADNIGRLMMGILGPYARIGPWRVRAGHRGGAANCTVAWLGKTMVGVCGWASDHTIGVIASPIRATTVSGLATLMVQMRYDLQRP